MKVSVYLYMILSSFSDRSDNIIRKTTISKSQIYVNYVSINSLSANPTKWPNTRKQFVGKLPTNCLSVFGHFDNLALKGLKIANTLKLLSAFAEVLIFNL